MAESNDALPLSPNIVSMSRTVVDGVVEEAKQTEPTILQKSKRCPSDAEPQRQQQELATRFVEGGEDDQQSDSRMERLSQARSNLFLRLCALDRLRGGRHEFTASGMEPISPARRR